MPTIDFLLDLPVWQPTSDQVLDGFDAFGLAPVLCQ